VTHTDLDSELDLIDPLPAVLTDDRPWAADLDDEDAYDWSA